MTSQDLLQLSAITQHPVDLLCLRVGSLLVLIFEFVFEEFPKCPTVQRLDATIIRLVIFFRFPKDKIRRKAWIHYCRRENFESVTRRLCSLHFSKDQYEVDPERRAELGYLNARARLKPTAVQDILLPLGRGVDLLTDLSASSTTTVKRTT